MQIFIPPKAFSFLEILANTFYLLSFDESNLTEVKQHIIVILTCISLKFSDVEHSFIYLLAIRMPSLEKCLY
jgi:hypothetical protein